MIRIAKHTEPARLLELKSKINDKEYMENAITRIAHTLTKEIFDMKESPNNGVPKQQT